MIAIFPEITAAVAAKDVERLAVLVRRYYGGPGAQTPAPDMRALVGRVGVLVRDHAMTDHGALLAKDERGAFRIIAVVAAAARGGGVAVERFLLAHLLGHYLYDVQPLIAGGDWTVAGFREAVCPARRYGSGDTEVADPREERADRFAAALLMPLGMARRAWQKLGDAARVAAVFGVPRAVAARRLEELALHSAVPANFLDAERRLVRPGASAAPPAPEAGESDFAPLDAIVTPVRRTRSPIYRASQQAKEASAPAQTRAAPRPKKAPAPPPPPAAAEGAAADPIEVPPPRSYAASTYRATERSTRMPEPPPESAAHEDAPPPDPKAEPLKGLDRIREIARKLDKTRG